MYHYGRTYRIDTLSPKYVDWVTGVTILPNYKRISSSKFRMKSKTTSNDKAERNDELEAKEYLLGKKIRIQLAHLVLELPSRIIRRVRTPCDMNQPDHLILHMLLPPVKNGDRLGLQG